jgi:hypothetical protein
MQWSSGPRREMPSRFRQKPSPQTSRAGRGLQARNYPKAKGLNTRRGGPSKDNCKTDSRPQPPGRAPPITQKAPRSGGTVGGKEKATMGAEAEGIAPGRADVIGRFGRECRDGDRILGIPTTCAKPRARCPDRSVSECDTDYCMRLYVILYAINSYHAFDRLCLSSTRSAEQRAGGLQRRSSSC